MTTSKVLGVLFLLTAATAWPQAQAPKDVSWAVSEFGRGEWAARLPLLLVRGWSQLPDHQVTPEELEAYRRQLGDAALLSLETQISKLKLDFDRKRLQGRVTGTETEANRKALADLEAKKASPVAQPAEKLPLRAVWSTGRDGLPWAFEARAVFAQRARADYLVTGTAETVGSYLRVSAELYSTLEQRVLAAWTGQFAPEEAPAQMAQVADRFRSFLLGRPWAGIEVTGSPGAQIKTGGQWHLLPWTDDTLVPGVVALTVQYPGREGEVQNVTLTEGQRTAVVLDSEAPARTLVIETEPAGASLYLDSRYLGPSPQTIARPLETARVRAQAPGWATAAREVGPATEALLITLTPPAEPVPVPAAKDNFYASLAVFSACLTSTAFVGAWRDEQVQLVNNYALAGAVAGYEKSYERFQAVNIGYGASIALTSAVFVWMMFELGDYLDAAQASLP